MSAFFKLGFIGFVNANFDSVKEIGIVKFGDFSFDFFKQIGIVKFADADAKQLASNLVLILTLAIIFYIALFVNERDDEKSAPQEQHKHATPVKLCKHLICLRLHHVSHLIRLFLQLAKLRDWLIQKHLIRNPRTQREKSW